MIRLRRALLAALLLLPLAPAGAELQAGIAAYDAGDYETALRELGPAAKAGDAEAQYRLGAMLLNGLGVPANPGAAVHWLRAAADQGHASAQTDLGWAYDTGTGLPEDPAEAVRLYRLAAKQGQPYAQANLGWALLSGRGVEPNEAAAASLFRQAADQGHAGAMSQLASMLADGVGLAQDRTEAERLFRAAVEMGDASAMNGLAWMLVREGRNLEEARDLARRAVEASPDDPNPLDTLALVEFRLGNAAEAAAHQEQVIALLGDTPWGPSHDRLGDFYAALGRIEEARQQWRLALETTAEAAAAGEVIEADWDRAAVERKLSETEAAPAPASAAALDAAFRAALTAEVRAANPTYTETQVEALSACVDSALAELPDEEKQRMVDAGLDLPWIERTHAAEYDAVMGCLEQAVQQQIQDGFGALVDQLEQQAEGTPPEDPAAFDAEFRAAAEAAGAWMALRAEVAEDQVAAFAACFADAYAAMPLQSGVKEEAARAGPSQFASTIARLDGTTAAETNERCAAIAREQAAADTTDTGAPDAGGVDAAVLQGEWLGSYVCAQGHTGLRLTIAAVDDTRLDGEFAFFAVPDNPTVPSGRYAVEGTFEPTARSVSLAGARWLDQPPGFGMVGLEGVLGEDGNVITGRIDDPACSTFEVVRQAAAGASADAPSAGAPGN